MGDLGTGVQGTVQLPSVCPECSLGNQCWNPELCVQVETTGEKEIKFGEREFYFVHLVELFLLECSVILKIKDEILKTLKS